MFAPICRDLLNAILDELSPHGAGQLIDVLAKLGALPDFDGDPHVCLPLVVKDAAFIRAMGVAA